MLADFAGGKWTTYRRMAQDAVDEIVKSGRVRTLGECCTVHMPLVGAQGFTPALFTEVAQNYTVPHRPGAIDTNVAKHLAGDHLIENPKVETALKARIVSLCCLELQPCSIVILSSQLSRVYLVSDDQALTRDRRRSSPPTALFCRYVKQGLDENILLGMV